MRRSLLTAIIAAIALAFALPAVSLAEPGGKAPKEKKSKGHGKHGDKKGKKGKKGKGKHDHHGHGHDRDDDHDHHGRDDHRHGDHDHDRDGRPDHDADHCHDHDHGRDDRDRWRPHRDRPRPDKDKVEVCHVPRGNPERGRILTVARPSLLRAHLDHGDCERFYWDGDSCACRPDRDGRDRDDHARDDDDPWRPRADDPQEPTPTATPEHYKIQLKLQ